MTEAGKPTGGGRKSVLDAYPGARRKPVVMQEGEDVSPRSTMIKVVVAAVLMIVAGVGALFVLKAMSGSRANSGPMLGEDARIVAMMDDEGVVDLDQWLDAYSGRMVMGMTREQAKAHSKRFRDMGAKNVYAFKASMMTASLVVELPDAPDKRAPIFQWYQDRWLTTSNQVANDVGQKYLLLIMHP